MVQTHTHIANASSYRVNHTGMRKGHQQPMLPAAKWAERERQGCGGWCLPSNAQRLLVLTGPGTHKEVLLPNVKTRGHCVNSGFTCSHLFFFQPLQNCPLNTRLQIFLYFPKSGAFNSIQISTRVIFETVQGYFKCTTEVTSDFENNLHLFLSDQNCLGKGKK